MFDKFSYVFFVVLVCEFALLIHVLCACLDVCVQACVHAPCRHVCLHVIVGI